MEILLDELKTVRQCQFDIGLSREFNSERSEIDRPQLDHALNQTGRLLNLIKQHGELAGTPMSDLINEATRLTPVLTNPVRAIARRVVLQKLSDRDREIIAGGWIIPETEDPGSVGEAQNPITHDGSVALHPPVAAADDRPQVIPEAWEPTAAVQQPFQGGTGGGGSETRRGARTFDLSDFGD